jgi:carbamoyl-phosphate synthase large subunit
MARQTGVDPWFLHKLSNIVSMEKSLLGNPLTPDLLRQAKRLGFSDEQVGTLADQLQERVRFLRRVWHIRPVYKMVDTCAAEFDAATPYFYSTYEEENEAEPEPGRKALVIGSGPIRIGQGIEFDYCSVHAVWALQEAGYRALIANSNPETVSTDFDTSDRLYFEPLDEEAVRDILENEAGDTLPTGPGSLPPPSIVQFGGQTAINLAGPLHQAAMPILGSSAEAIDLAEDRQRFEDFLQKLGIPQPPGAAVTIIEDALTTAQTIGYPVLVRPSYVLGGRAMEIVQNASELIRYMRAAVEVGSGKPILIDKYMEGREVEVDAIGDGERVLIPGIMEHIERAGVHSGDSMAVYPPLSLSEEEISAIVDYTERIGLGLGVQGLMNIQFVIMPNGAPAEPPGGRASTGVGYARVGPPAPTSTVYVLEVNPRASRTVPFLSKVTGVPMVRLAVNVMLGKSLAEQGYFGGLWPPQNLVAIKAPVFSMAKLIGVDTYLGPEMKSTGEVMGVDRSFPAALAKALLSADLMLPPPKADAPAGKGGGILVSLSDRTKPEAMPIVRQLASLGYRLYATAGTAAMLEALGLPVEQVARRIEEGHPNVVDVIQEGLVGCVINTAEGGQPTAMRDGFQIRRAAAERRIPCFTSIDTARAVTEALLRGAQTYIVQPLRLYRDGQARLRSKRS